MATNAIDPGATALSHEQLIAVAGNLGDPDHAAPVLGAWREEIGRTSSANDGVRVDLLLQ